MPKSKLKASEWIESKIDEKYKLLKYHCTISHCLCGINSARYNAILDYLDQLEDGQKYVRLASCDDTCMATPCPRHLATDGDYII